MRFPFASLLFMSVSVTATATTLPTLKVLTWEEYLAPEVAELFQAETGIALEFIYFDNDEVRDQIMAETYGHGFDIILVDELELPAYVGQKWVAPLDVTILTNLPEHGTQWSKVVPEANGYAVPYGWGDYGIVYRTDLVKKPPTKWADLFDASNELAGHIQMTPQASEMLIIALMALGYPATETNPDALKSAEVALLRQKQIVKAYQTTNYEPETNLLNQGTVKASVSYNSDAIFMINEFENLDYVSPIDGNIFWIDFWTISENSKQKDHAHTFLNFLLRADITAMNVEYQYTATFSEAAKKQISPEILNDRIIFPEVKGDINVMTAPTRDTIRTMMKIINALDIN